MALEDQLRENTDAINRLTAVTENLMKLRTEAIDTVKEAGKTGKATKKTPPKKDTPEREISDNPENRTDPDTDGTSSDGPSYDTLADTIKAYVGMDDDKDGRAERTANVRKIFGHKKIKAKTAKDVPEEMIGVVISNIEKLHKEAVEAAGSDSDDDDLMG